MEAVEYHKLKPLKEKWDGFKMSGSVDLSFTERETINEVFKKIFKIETKRAFCLHCPEEVTKAFAKVFFQFDNYIDNQPKEKRNRIC